MFVLLCTGLGFLGLQSQLGRHCYRQRGVDTQQVIADPVDVANYSDPWRPQVHYTPEQNWLNDPNGLFKDDDGLWHMYYQCKVDLPDLVLVSHTFLTYEKGGLTIIADAHSINPGEIKDWAHATSRDLYTWDNQPVAIAASANGSIWSGSIVIDVNNTSGFFPHQTNGIVAFYTNWTPAEEAQAIAYSYDGGYTFIKYINNPVISLNMHGFRDPKVIWYEKTQKWIMIVSHADEQFIAFYTSTNLTSWSQVSTFSNAAITGVFECPQFLPIPFHPSSTPASSTSPDLTKDTEYYLLVISLGGGGPSGTSTVKYFPGSFNGTHFTAVDDLATRVMDFGEDFYATAFFYNLHPPVDPNPISISWAVNLNYAGASPTGPAEGWRSAMTVARTHYLANITSTGYNLISEPYNIAPMYDYLLSSEKGLGNGGLAVDYSSLSSGAVSFVLNVTTSTSAASNASVEIDFTSSSTGESITLSLNLLSGSSSANTTATAARFEMSRANITGWTHSAAFPTFALTDLLPFSSTELDESGSKMERYEIRGIMDRTILEAFVNGGVDAGTMVFFPNGRLNTIVLKIGGLGSGSWVDFEAWGLSSGWSSAQAGNGAGGVDRGGLTATGVTLQRPEL
jgi:beta-fructofuranosidase